MVIVKKYKSIKNTLNFIILILCSFSQLNAQDWIWLDGSNEINGEANYAEIFPGAREGSVTWKDDDGNFWLFGGRKDNDYYNDLWKYDISQNEWIFMEGSDQPNQSIDFPLGIGSIAYAVGWQEGDYIYLFGGYGYDRYGNLGNLNDMWRKNITYASSSWFHIDGDREIDENAIYGIKGVANYANTPGGRNSSSVWADNNGNLWLFGGKMGTGNNTAINTYFTDLWKYDGSDWAWMGGLQYTNAYGDYGTKGTPSASNRPGARASSVAWQDANGNFYIWGGHGFGGQGSGGGNLNDLWKYNINTELWTWINGSNTVDQPGTYGIKGQSNPLNIPGGRYGAVGWNDNTNNNFWLFGGWGNVTNSTSDFYMNDLWQYNLLNDQWTWVKGWNNGIGYTNYEYGTMGIPAINNSPGNRYYSMGWIDDSNNLWLFGGWAIDSQNENDPINDLWKFNILSWNWTWVNGSNKANQTGAYDPLVDSYPGARNSFNNTQSDPRNFWLFGGSGIDINDDNGYLSDLWQFDGFNWKWVKGSSVKDKAGKYGTLNQPSLSNNPGSRKNGIFEAIDDKTLLLFGGYGYDEAGIQGWLNDLWEFNITTNNWTWIGGDQIVNQVGVYDDLGTPSPNTKPGSRDNSMSWFDPNNDLLWIFGGLGFGANGSSGLMNDLLYYNNGSWAWMKGDKNPGAKGVYGSLGVPSSSNIPGSRTGAVTWIDASGNLWMFGGNGKDINGDLGSLNDLWKYNPFTNEFTWMGGSNTINQTGSYFVAPINLQPGARYDAKGWVDANGDFYLFGGFGYATTNQGRLNDLWKYDVSLGIWTFVKGSSTTNQTADYGSQNMPAISNTPGSTYSYGTWIDDGDNLYLFGGFGHDNENNVGNLNSFWKFGIPFLNLNLKIALEGPYENYGFMGDNLDLSSQLSHPYINIHTGSETLSSNFFSYHFDIVDWVVVELRTGTAANTKVTSRAALLKENGSIVDLDGVSPVTFNSISSGNYYVVVHHRNHLAIMSANPISIQ